VRGRGRGRGRGRLRVRVRARGRLRLRLRVRDKSQGKGWGPGSRWWHVPWWEHWSGPQACAASHALPLKPGSQKHWSCLGRGRGRGWR